MGLADEIEQWLANGGGDVTAIPVIKESPTTRYRPDTGWYRKCHRCDTTQKSELPLAFESLVHICMRDSTLKEIHWPKFPRWS